MFYKTGLCNTLGEGLTWFRCGTLLSVCVTFWNFLDVYTRMCPQAEHKSSWTDMGCGPTSVTPKEPAAVPLVTEDTVTHTCYLCEVYILIKLFFLNQTNFRFHYKPVDDFLFISSIHLLIMSPSSAVFL